MGKRSTMTEAEHRQKYQEMNPKDVDKIDDLFGQLEDTETITEQITEKENEDAIKTYKDLIVQQYETVNLHDVKFKFRKHATALEFEERQLISDPEAKLAHLHKFLVDPIMPVEDFLQLPPEIPKYIEQKIMEDFIRGLVQIALQNSPNQELEN